MTSLNVVFFHIHSSKIKTNIQFKVVEKKDKIINKRPLLLISSCRCLSENQSNTATNALESYNTFFKAFILK